MWTAHSLYQADKPSFRVVMIRAFKAVVTLWLATA